MSDDELDRWVRERMYDPHTEPDAVEEEVRGLVGELGGGGGNGNGIGGKGGGGGGWEGARL